MPEAIRGQLQLNQLYRMSQRLSEVNFSYTNSTELSLAQGYLVLHNFSLDAVLHLTDDKATAKFAFKLGQADKPSSALATLHLHQLYNYYQ